MTDLATLLPSPNQRTREHLEKLREALRTDLGDRLVGMLVFGSAVRGGYDPERSDVDVVVVVRDDDRASLERIGPALELARRAARIEAVVLREDELQSAADVFPLFYDDIRGCHVLIAGKDAFTGLVIHDHHRRLRIEQELRDARIRLRRAVAESTVVTGLLAGSVERKLKQLRGPLHALLRLRGIAVADALPAVLAAAGERWTIETGPLSHVRDDPTHAYDILVRLLDAAIADVDAITEGGPS